MSRDIIKPSLPIGDITYQDAKRDILRELGSTVCIIEHKDLTLSEFANQFYHKAQVLLGASAMVEHDVKLAMKNAVKPYQELYWAMNLFLSQEFTMVQMLDYLCRLEATQNAPNKEKPRYTCPANTSTPSASGIKTRPTQERQIPLTDITCFCCFQKGHYATKCPILMEGACGLCPHQGAGKRPSSVEEGYSTELEINVPPDKQRFVEDEPIDPLHQIVSNDVCAVLTQSQKAALEEEGEAIVAQPYT
ncbi:hypothetical protein DSO57_1019607 [Entomophthora muscae]|uniref:Uncharacterized protein n=1 Tax=Entomophthora muscae TaxID=34485 RepID=A0ACC2U2G8_9FUNG|nr:hypothetical protein DSO57_1019607 [Entomophthora muscae]